MKTGFFGGSFNPVHLGHIRLAEYLLAHYPMDEIRLSLSPENPLKQANHPGGATELDRLEMLRIACAGHKGLRPWDGELRMPRPSYTVNVLAAMRENSIDPVLIIGADNWLNFNKWYKSDEILANYAIILYQRPGFKLNETPKHENVKFALNAPLTDVSSTEIRNNITENLSLLPEGVADYIKMNKLYGY